MECPRALGPHFVANLPNTLRQVVDEERHFAITQFLVDPARAAREIIRGTIIHEFRLLSSQRPGFYLTSIDVLAAANLYGFESRGFQVFEKQILIVVLGLDG